MQEKELYQKLIDNELLMHQLLTQMEEDKKQSSNIVKKDIEESNNKQLKEFKKHLSITKIATVLGAIFTAVNFLMSNIRFNFIHLIR